MRCLGNPKEIRLVYTRKENNELRNALRVINFVDLCECISYCT